MKIIITGRPRSGKTTLVKEIISTLEPGSAFGFYTEEVRVEGTRVGFILRTLGGEERLLAHVDFGGRWRVGKYGVDIDTMWMGIREIERGIRERGLIIVDEIGKMELFVDEFKEILLRVLNGDHSLLATMGMIDDPFVNKIRQRRDTECIALTRQNYSSIKAVVLRRLKEEIGLKPCSDNHTLTQ